MYRSIKNISIILIAAQGICLQSFGDAVDLAAMKDNIDHLEKDCGVPPAKIASAMADIQRADLASPMCEMAKTRGVSAVDAAGPQQMQQMVDAGGCGATADSKKAAAYAQLKAAASGAKVPAPLKDNSNQAQINRCKAAKDAISSTADKVATASGMNAMQMMQMGQMGMSMLSSLASLAGNSSGSGSGGSGSQVTGPTAPVTTSIGDSAVTSPTTDSSTAPSTTGASSASTPSTPFSANLVGATPDQSGSTPPDSSVTAPNGGAATSGAGGSGALASTGGSSTDAKSASATAAAGVNPLLAMNAPLDDGSSAAGGGAMLGLKSSNDFQGMDPMGKDAAPGPGAAGALGGGMDPNDPSRGLASGEPGQDTVAQNDVHDQGTSLFELVSGKMREMKKRGSL